MDAMLALLTITTIVAGLGLLAARFGSDSRDAIVDDHRRQGAW